MALSDLQSPSASTDSFSNLEKHLRQSLSQNPRNRAQEGKPLARVAGSQLSGLVPSALQPQKPAAASSWEWGILAWEAQSHPQDESQDKAPPLWDQ